MLIEPPIRYFGKENVTSCLTLPSIVNNVPMPYHFIHTLVARLNIQIKNQISPRISIKDFLPFHLAFYVKTKTFSQSKILMYYENSRRFGVLVNIFQLNVFDNFPITFFMCH